ncbi:MAG TPA: hypothetical protein VN132_06100, partial [Bdellovibrio sp.]|nr:hypothetical protein [Bdellovibrio sp.]
MKSIWALFLYSSVALSGHLAWSQQNLRGLRVDPAYFQSLYPDRAPADIARTVVLQAQSHGVNTLFLYAYSPLHGAFYKTNYPMTEVEPDLGAQGIFALIYNEALSRGLKIIASIPINDFHQVWDLHPDWRSKKIDGTDYKPFTR